jgi:hypothetical protein
VFSAIPEESVKLNPRPGRPTNTPSRYNEYATTGKWPEVARVGVGQETTTTPESAKAATAAVGLSGASNDIGARIVMMVVLSWELPDAIRAPISEVLDRRATNVSSGSPV